MRTLGPLLSAAAADLARIRWYATHTSLRASAPPEKCGFIETGKDNPMILGLNLAQFTFLHVFLSLVGIGAGIFIIFGLLTSRRLSILTTLFLVTTLFTSLTGFLFPFKGVTPGIIIGVLSTIALILAMVALYVKHLTGIWRGVYVISVCLAFYFNFFVLIAQTFDKVPTLKAAAPTMESPAFGVTQLALLLIFILLTVRAVKKYNPA
jgi:hypothetical protein